MSLVLFFVLLTGCSTSEDTVPRADFESLENRVSMLEKQLKLTQAELRKRAERPETPAPEKKPAPKPVRKAKQVPAGQKTEAVKPIDPAKLAEARKAVGRKAPAAKRPAPKR